VVLCASLLLACAQAAGAGTGRMAVWSCWQVSEDWVKAGHSLVEIVSACGRLCRVPITRRRSDWKYLHFAERGEASPPVPAGACALGAHASTCARAARVRCAHGRVCVPSSPRPRSARLHRRRRGGGGSETRRPRAILRRPPCHPCRHVIPRRPDDCCGLVRHPRSWGSYQPRHHPSQGPRLTPASQPASREANGSRDFITVLAPRTAPPMPPAHAKRSAHPAHSTTLPAGRLRHSSLHAAAEWRRCI